MFSTQAAERWRKDFMKENGMRFFQIHESDLQKLADAIDNAVSFHANRDRMNASLHLAKEIRYSPLTSELLSAQERIRLMLAAEVSGPDLDSMEA